MALERWMKNDFVFYYNTNLNELIYEKAKNDYPYYKINPKETFKIHPDNISGIIIDELIERIKK